MLDNISFGDVILSVIKAVDVVNPILKNHHKRVAIIAYHLGLASSLGDQDLAILTIAASLHDIGALTIEDEKALMRLDVQHPEDHEKMGASMLSSFKAFSTISTVIKHHHVHYTQYHEQKEKQVIHPLSLLLHTADRMDILLSKSDMALNSLESAHRRILELPTGTFDPFVLKQLDHLVTIEEVWLDVDHLSLDALLSRLDLSLICPILTTESLEELVCTLSKIIDYKSNFTATHSIAVANVAYALAKAHGLSDEHSYAIKVAGYLHDIGKIGIPTELLLKPTALSHQEFNHMKTHPYITRHILSSIRGFEEITDWAASHHETLDQSGYPRKPKHIGLEITILSYADVFVALSEERPYRPALDLDQVLATIEKEFSTKLGLFSYQVLCDHSKDLYNIQLISHMNAKVEYDETMIESLYT